MNHITKLQENLLTAVQTSPYHEKTIVFGEGAEAPLLMMIGEAPGGDEEKQGRPFVGKAGKNLSAFLEVVGLKREEIYISNVVKLRPTKESPKTGKAVNRPPSAEDRVFPALFTGGNPNDCAKGACDTGKCPPQGGHRGEKSRHRGLSWQTCRAGGWAYPVCSLSPCGSHL